MSKRIAAGLAVLMAISLAGCGYTPEQRATTGGAIGAGTGAALGAASGGGVGGALAGGFLGGAVGALIGATTPPPRPYYYPAPPPCAHWGRDPYGNPYCVAYYGY